MSGHQRMTQRRRKGRKVGKGPRGASLDGEQMETFFLKMSQAALLSSDRCSDAKFNVAWREKKEAESEDHWKLYSLAQEMEVGGATPNLIGVEPHSPEM